MRASLTSYPGACSLDAIISTSDNGPKILPEMFKHRLVQLAEETVDSLQTIWREAGYEDAECHRLLGDLMNKMRFLCSNELAAENQILEHAKQEIVLKTDQLKNLFDQLGRDYTTQIESCSSMNCTDKLVELERLIDDIQIEVSQRQLILDNEMNAINDLSKCLDEPCPEKDSDIFQGPEGTPTLSDLRLNLMRQCKADLESVKSRRMEEMKNIIKDCKQHITDLVLMEEGMN